MPDISKEIAKIQNAVYGEEVRGSIIDALEKVNDDNGQYQSIKEEVTAAASTVKQQVEAIDTKSSEVQQSINSLTGKIQSATSAGNELDTKTSAAGSAKTALDTATSAANSLKDSLQQQTDIATTTGAKIQKAADDANAAAIAANNAASKANAAANSAADAKNTLESISADYSTLSGKVDKNTSGIRDLKEDKLDKPNNPVVGQFLRVKSISDTGEIVLETMAGGGGGGLPNGGTVGQVLAKKSNADGDTEWANIKSEKVTADNITQALGYTPRKAWYVNVTLGNPITADKTAAEIWQAYQDGYSVFAKIVVDGLYPYTLPLVLPMGAETFGFAAVGQLSEDSVPMTVCLAYNTGEWRFFTSEIAPSSAIPTALKNPNALTIKIGSSTTVTYDGSSAKTVEIADGTEVSY